MAIKYKIIEKGQPGVKGGGTKKIILIHHNLNILF